MNYLLIISMLNFVCFCNFNNTEEHHNYKITSYQKIEDGYNYSKYTFIYKSNTYRPILTAEYANDTLVSVWMFKSEGKISYSKTDIESDSLLIQVLNTPLSRIIDIDESQVIDNGRPYQITESIKDSIFRIQKDTLIIYILN